jgi:serine/threonine protein kinase
VTLNIAAQLCDALDHAHTRCDERGKPLHIVHRDVSPANIILSDTGHVKLIDFGLARTSVTEEHTEAGVLKGKFGYIAPEYTRGSLDHRADLWAVGIIMYELLTSRRLFDGPDPMQTLRRVREMPVPRPSLANPRVTSELDEIVMTALARDPARRWSSAAAMRDRIRAVIAQPGNAMDNAGVIDWVNWAFAQRRGRAPQLTPMMAMPVRTSSDDTSEYVDIDGQTVQMPIGPRFAMSKEKRIAIASGLLFLFVLIVWKLRC